MTRSALLAAALLPAAAHAQVPTDPIAHWPLDGDTLDVSGNAQHAPLPPTLTFRVGRCGLAADIETRSDEIIAPGQTAPTWSVSAWARPDALGTWDSLWANEGVDGVGGVSTVRLHNDVHGGRIGHSWHYANGTTGEHQSSGLFATPGAWVHVVATHTKGVGTTIWVNGVQTTTGSFTAQSWDDFTGHSFYIGSTGWSNEFDHMDGLVADVRVFDRVLAPAEIAALYTESPDSDGDGTCDARDLCVGDDAFGDADGDGACDDPAADTDGDGAADAVDPCPGVADDGTDTDGDGFGDACAHPSAQLDPSVNHYGRYVAPKAAVGAGASLGLDSALGRRVALGAGAAVGPRTVFARAGLVGADASIGSDGVAGYAVTLGERAAVGDHARLGNLAVIGADAIVGDGVSVGRDADVLGQVGDGASVGPGAQVGAAAVVGDGARLRRDAQVHGAVGADAVVGRGAQVHANATVGEGARLGAGAVIGAYATVADFDTVPRGATVSSPSLILGADGHRAWADGTLAASCEGYRRPTDGHAYAGATGSGTYRVDPDGDGLAPVVAYCDMETDDGGWQLLLAYAHAGGTNKPLVSALPTSPDAGYSHQYLAQTGYSSPPSEVRFYCQTALHARRMHFRTANAQIREDAFDGRADAAVSDWNTGFTALPGHSAYAPAQVDASYNGETDGFTNFPFYRGGAYHWGIRGLGGRWECDDFAASGAYATLHQVWWR